MPEASKRVYKDINGGYPSKWEQYSGQGYWAEAGSAEDKLEAGYDYLVPNGLEFRTPFTANAIAPFPGDSLTVEHSTFHIYSHKNARLAMSGDLTFKNPLSVVSPVGNIEKPGAHTLLSQIDCRVSFENNSGSAGKVTLAAYNNTGLGQSYNNTVKADATLTFDVDSVTTPTEDYRYFFWVKFLGDTSEFLSAINVKTNAALFLGANGLANAGMVTLRGADNPENAAALGSEAPGYAVPVKSLACQANSRLWIATSARGETSPFRVTDSYSQAGLVYVCLTNYPAKMPDESTNFKLEILRVASGAGTLSKDGFVFRGYTAGAGAVISNPPMAGTSAFSVETDATSGDSVLYLTLTPVVNCVKNQSGTMNGRISEF